MGRQIRANMPLQKDQLILEKPGPISPKEPRIQKQAKEDFVCRHRTQSLPVYSPTKQMYALLLEIDHYLDELWLLQLPLDFTLWVQPCSGGFKPDPELGQLFTHQRDCNSIERGMWNELKFNVSCTVLSILACSGRMSCIAIATV